MNSNVAFQAPNQMVEKMLLNKKTLYMPMKPQYFGQNFKATW